MEILNENQIPQEPRNNPIMKDPKRGGYLFLGIMLIATGMLWLFHNIGFIGHRLFDILFSWEVLMIVVGGYLLSVKRYTAGIIVAAFGVLFFLMNIFHIYISFSKVILPAIVIAIGVSLLIPKDTRRY